MEIVSQDQGNSDFRVIMEMQRASRRGKCQGWEALEFLDLPVIGEDMIPVQLSCLYATLYAWGWKFGEEREEFRALKERGQIFDVPSCRISKHLWASTSEIAATPEYSGIWEQDPLLVRYRQISAYLPEVAATPASLLMAMVSAVEGKDASHAPKSCKFKLQTVILSVLDVP